ELGDRLVALALLEEGAAHAVEGGSPVRGGGEGVFVRRDGDVVLLALEGLLSAIEVRLRNGGRADRGQRHSEEECVHNWLSCLTKFGEECDRWDWLPERGL